MTDTTISKAACDARVGVETIRFYERRGLIDRPPKPPSGDYRRYRDETKESYRCPQSEKWRSSARDALSVKP